MRWPGSARGELNATPALGVIIVGVLLSLGGVAAAGSPLLVAGLGVALLGVAAPLWVWLTAAGLLVQAELGSDTVTEGDPVELTVRLDRRGPARFAAVGLEHTMLSTPRRVTGDGRRAQRLLITGEAGGIGVVHPAAPTWSIADPLGLCRLRHPGAPLGRELLVLPRPGPVHFRDAGGLLGAEGTAAGGAGADALDLAGLAEYVPGTPATRIHWPALASSNTLLQRVYERPVGARPALALDLRCPDPAHASAGADAVRRAAASLAVALARDGGVEVWLPGRAAPLQLGPGLAAWPALGRALARAGAVAVDAPGPRLAPDGGALVIACLDPVGVAGRLGARRERVLALSPPSALGGSAEVVLETAGCIAAPVGGR